MSAFGPKPEFATNQDGNRVADALSGHLAYLRSTWAKPYDAAIATAYFNVGGYGLIADELDHVSHVRLLLGAEPPVPERRVRRLSEAAIPSRAERARLRASLGAVDQELGQDRDLLGFTHDADISAKRLVKWLRSGKVDVRRYESGFLHGKAFIVTTDDEGVMAGSSNFTYAGLAKNQELNLGHYQSSVVERVRSWFDTLWEESQPYDLAAIYEARFEPHVPYLIYLRMLLERYGAELEAEREAQGAPQIHLASFQRDGLWRARQILTNHHGVLIADEVGLGKTFLAGELIREAVEQRRQRVLVIAPATLRDGPWAKFLDRYMLAVQCVSYEDLAGDERLNPEATGIKLNSAPDEYAMVVVDEAQAFRNPSTQRASALRRLLQGTPPKDLVLLTATPVNNSLWDLYYLLSLWLRNDAAFAHVGVRSLRDHFAAAMALDPDDLTPAHLFDILDAVAVRRTRPFVRRYYPNDTIPATDGAQMTITFPTPRVIRIRYDLDQALPGFFDRFGTALDWTPTNGSAPPPPGQPALTLARYAPSRYRLAGGVDAYELQLAGLLRSGLLKRFESSSYAFARTCRTMAESHDAFLGLLHHGRVATGEALSDWIATDSDEITDVQRFLDRTSADTDDATLYDVAALRRDVIADRDLLLSFAVEAQKVRPEDDPKLAAIVEELAVIASQAAEEGIGEQDTRDKRKILIFSYFADTVEWITGHLEHIVERDERLAAFRGRIASVTGSGGNKSDVMWGFAPRTTDAPVGRDEDRYDLLVATDVLAEGVNLQQARHMLNADLPWNPMRLVQRHGRIDRIGSPHGEVFMRCVFPDQQLDALLGLEERLHRKISQAAASVGVAGEVLPGSRTSDQVYTQTREEIDQLREGKATLFEQAGETDGAHSGEEYRQELRKALENLDTQDRVRSLPWGAGSGMTRPGTKLGFVFCARVADHDTAQYRYVEDNDGFYTVIDDTLACLAHGRPDHGSDQTRVLSDETHERAYLAWEAARRAIHDQWMIATDPANLVPAVPRTMRAAAALLREHPLASLTQADIDRLIDAIEQPYPQRIQQQIRDAFRSSDHPLAQAEAVAAKVRELGLQPAPAPEPLPVITEDDIHLVCWLVITPE